MMDGVQSRTDKGSDDERRDKIGFVKSSVSEDLCSGSKRRGFDEFVGLVRYLSWEFILKRPDNYSILYGYGANGKFH